MSGPSDYLNDGMRPREVWSWACYDFANSGYTTVVITAIFNAYFVAVVAGNATWATFAWTAALSVSYAAIVVTAPLIGAWADAHAAKKRLLAITTVGCVAGTAALYFAGPGDLAIAISGWQHRLPAHASALRPAFAAADWRRFRPVEQHVLQIPETRRLGEQYSAVWNDDIWMTTIAVAEGFRVCQSFLGAKLQDAKDPGADLSEMLHQVVGSVFALMREYRSVWKNQRSSEDIDLFGFRFGVGLDPVEVDTGRMLEKFRYASRELGEVWELALCPATRSELQEVASALGRNGNRNFRLGDELVRIIMDFAVSWRERPAERGHLLRSLTPLYLAKVASFVMETRDLVSEEVEQRIERLCGRFEELKPYLVAAWDQTPNRRSAVALTPQRSTWNAKR